MIDTYSLIRASEVEIGDYIQYEDESEEGFKEEFFLVEDLETNDEGDIIFYDAEDDIMRSPSDALIRTMSD